MPEWLMGTDCKFVDNVYAGSNPARPNTKDYLISFLANSIKVRKNFMSPNYDSWLLAVFT